jgi:MoaA/NifB/PqqE/SkfB family radical SAM enzyme
LPMTVRQGLYYLKFGLQCFVLGRRKPIVGGVELTDLCNLRCRHCVVADETGGHHSLERIRGWMRELYERGARVLYLQGGEAFSWSDGDKKLEHVVRLAREMGYFKVAVVTNGTYPIETEADLVWVSIDGSASVHDRIRGQGVFGKVARNLAASSHPNLYANMTVNRLNRGEAGAVVRFVAKHPRLKGVSFNLHTPYPGVEELALSAQERADLVKELLRWKREGYPILNTAAGLKLLASGKYKRPIWLIQLVELGRVFECCWGRMYEGVCERCGYGIIAELSGLSRMRPSGLLRALQLFTAGGRAL